VQWGNFAVEKFLRRKLSLRDDAASTPAHSFGLLYPQDHRKREGIALENKVSPGFPLAAPRTTATRRFLASLRPRQARKRPREPTSRCTLFSYGILIFREVAAIFSLRFFMAISSSNRNALHVSRLVFTPQLAFTAYNVSVLSISRKQFSRE